MEAWSRRPTRYASHNSLQRVTRSEATRAERVSRKGIGRDGPSCRTRYAQVTGTETVTVTGTVTAQSVKRKRKGKNERRDTETHVPNDDDTKPSRVKLMRGIDNSPVRLSHSLAYRHRPYLTRVGPHRLYM
jgi:hypothetical protein